MGMYTEINVALELKKDIPPDVVSVLTWMCACSDEDRPKTPKHAFFDCDRWDMLFCCDSYYFRGQTHSEFKFDDIADAWFLTVRANLKNYSDEIEQFMDWIAPYIYAIDGDFIGYSRYEENEWPTLWHYQGGKMVPTQSHANPQERREGEGKG